MFSTVRRYLGMSPDLAAELERKGEDMIDVLRHVPGLLSYQLVRTRDGMFAVTVCRDEASAIEASRRAAAWMGSHIPGVTLLPLEVWSGPVTVNVSGEAI
jgi:hypothetical protein